MPRSTVQLLDLSDELLLILFKKLNNVDVLDLLFKMNNQRLNILAHEKIFCDTLDFLSYDPCKLDRFCVDILPKIHCNITCFVLESVTIKRILLSTNYPNLTKLKILNFNQEFALKYFTDQSLLRYIFQEQITDLILGNSDNIRMIKSSTIYTKYIYTSILNIFKKLKHFSIIDTFNRLYPYLSFDKLLPTAFLSSTLTYLCINVCSLYDCLYLLDGRLKQLSTFIVQIIDVVRFTSIVDNRDKLPNLKYFSFKCRCSIDIYDENILPLLHRMSYLEKLTLYIHISKRHRSIDRNHLENEIYTYMPRLQSFIFYISTITDSLCDANNEDGQQILTYLREKPIVNITNRTVARQKIVNHIFTLPFVFDQFESIGCTFPNIKFQYVTYLLVEDVILFDHEFFVRLSYSFPQLNRLRIINLRLKTIDTTFNNAQPCVNAKFPHLTSLNVISVGSACIDAFLNGTKSFLPCLTELIISYTSLVNVTDNFTREETRRNCANVKRLNILGIYAHTKDFYLYFPSLEMSYFDLTNTLARV